MEHLKKYWYWYLLGLIVILFLTRKYWMPSKNSITVKNVDWDKKTATVDLRSGNIGGDEDISLTTAGKTPTTNGFVHVIAGDASKNTITLAINKRASSEPGVVTSGENIKTTVIDFTNKKVTVIK